MYIYHAVKQLFVCVCGAVRAGSYVCLAILIKKGLSRARHCAAASGSRAGAGLHGMGVRFRLASNEIVETSLGKPAVCKYARRPLAGTWTSQLESPALGPGQY